ncbi:MAG: D-amino-acid transaminase [Proteobacteria bacterium]|nr:D-amino-acid transaminase [Pseudomonadota bacterium]MDA1355750.1 D-amino-acid transaminase [Pseudomonadota bacterium]
MSRIAYVNGQYVAHAEAQIHVEDRGYQFADGVYEVAAIFRGLIIDEDGHLARLKRSLGELQMPMPMLDRPFAAVCRETLRRNRVRDGIIYIQVSRGVSRRDHPFPKNVKPALVMTARAVEWPLNADDDSGAKVVSVADIRWLRRDVKSISLLPNVLAKQEAREKGAYEAWLVDADGFVTEGSSTNAWIVDGDGNIVTRQLDNNILGGITRATILELAREHGMEVIERPFSLAEALAAPEAFLSSTTSFVRGIIGIDGSVIGDGAPGPVTRRLRALYLDYCRGAGSNE